MTWNRWALPLALALAAMLALAALAAGARTTAAEETAPAAITDVAAACAEPDAHAALASLCELHAREGLPAVAKASLAKIILRIANGEHGHRFQALKACRTLVDAAPDAESDAAAACRTLLGERAPHSEQLCERVLAAETANAPEKLIARCKALLDDEPARCRRLAGQPEANATATEELRARCRQLIGEKADEFCKRMAELPQNATNVSPELQQRCKLALASAGEHALKRACAAFAANPATAAVELRERCQKPPTANAEAQCKELAANPQLAAAKPDLQERCANLLNAKPPTPRPEFTLDACRRVLAGEQSVDGVKVTDELFVKCKQFIEREGAPRPKPTATERAR